MASVVRLRMIVSDFQSQKVFTIEGVRHVSHGRRISGGTLALDAKFDRDQTLGEEQFSGFEKILQGPQEECHSREQTIWIP